MLGNKKGKMICGYVPDYVLFDLETTGTSCIYDEVIEISAVKVRSGKVVEEFSQLVNPKRPIPYAASMVNHISDEMVANEPDFGQGHLKYRKRHTVSVCLPGELHKVLCRFLSVCSETILSVQYSLL